jgi:hypothetical protein
MFSTPLVGYFHYIILISVKMIEFHGWLPYIVQLKSLTSVQHKNNFQNDRVYILQCVCEFEVTKGCDFFKQNKENRK